MTIVLTNGKITGGSIGVFNPKSLGPSYLLDPKKELNLVKDGADKVSQFLDSSGNGKTADQGTDIQRPIWTPSAIGSNSALVYDGSNDKMVMGGFNWPLQWHLFIVIKPSSTSGVRVILSSYDGSGGLGNQGEYILDHRNGTLLFQAFNTSPPLSTTGIIAGNTYLIELYSDASKNLEMFLNNVSVDTGTHGTAAATRPINIGEDEPVSGSQHYAGSIGDNIMLPAKLSTADQTLMRNYFASNYPTIGL
jgi:hypothetical protein